MHYRVTGSVVKCFFCKLGGSLILLIISARVDLLSSCMIDAPTLRSVRSFCILNLGEKGQQGGREVEGMDSARRPVGWCVGMACCPVGV